MEKFSVCVDSPVCFLFCFIYLLYDDVLVSFFLPFSVFSLASKVNILKQIQILPKGIIQH